jgi:hypothetical protein
MYTYMYIHIRLPKHIRVRIATSFYTCTCNRRKDLGPGLPTPPYTVSTQAAKLCFFVNKSFSKEITGTKTLN